MIRFNHIRNSWEVSTPTGWNMISTELARQYVDWGFEVALDNGFGL